MVGANRNDSDATLTDDLENQKAMDQLQEALLSSSGSDIEDREPVPRSYLKRNAKLNPKDIKKRHSKSKKRIPLTAAERQEKAVLLLAPEQRK